ncbi:MAG: CHAT domain-containing protein, partial [Candidatus Odinarchaeota archaeon]
NLDYWKGAVQIYQDLADHYFSIITENGISNHNLKTLELYKKLDKLIDETTARILSPVPQREFHVRFTYVGYRIFNLYQMIYEDFWEDFLIEALGMVEKYKGFDLFLSLEDASNRQKYWEQLNELEYEIIIKSRYLEEETDAEKKKELKNRIEELQNRYYDIENEMIIKSSRYYTSMGEDPTKLMLKTLEPLQPLFQKFKFGLLYFAMDQNVLYIIGFAKDNIVREVIEFDQAKLDKADVILAHVREGAAAITSKEDMIKLDKFLKKLSGWLSKHVMTPQIVELIEELDYLTIIPSGLFINYPLEILRFGDEYFGTRFKLSREFNLKLLSEQYKKVLEQKWYQYNYQSKNEPISDSVAVDILRNENDVIFVSNPNFEELMVIPESEIELKIVSKELAESKEYQNLEKSDFWDMDLGKTEVQSLTPLFDEKKVKYQALIDTEVSKEKLTSEQYLTDDVKIFHFAGHALFDDETPQLSKLVLRNSKVMTPMDLQKYRFRNNPLIVFSACESGVSEVQLGDEPFGFLRFTKIMNGQNIIFSLWPVLSRPTTKLMVSFYDNLIKGESVAGAMRNARVELIDAVNEEKEKLGYYKDLELFYWSPFSFIGMPFYNYQVEVEK